MDAERESLPSSVLEISSEESFRPRSFSDVVKRIEKNRIKEDIQSFNYDPKSQRNVYLLGKDLFAIASSQSTSGTQSTKIKRVLRDLTPVINQKFEVLQQKVDNWKKVRLPLIEKLEIFIESLDKRSKLCSIVRLLASTADATGSIGGLLLSSESDWAKYAFNAASVCGLCGLFFTVIEVASSKKILDEVSKLTKEDYNLFESVVTWFQENPELDSAVQDMFPHGIDKDVAMQIQEASIELEDHIKVFESALVSNVRKDSGLLGNKDFLYSLQLFCQSDVANLWWNRIIFRKHPIHLDINRMMLQMEFGHMQSLVFQSIPALPLEQQRLTSLPVAGRIMLNCLTMYDAASNINKGAKSMYSDNLRKLLSSMKSELIIIDDAVRKMKPAESRGLIV